MNEDLTLKKQCELVHFQSSARSAKKSNDFFGFTKRVTIDDCKRNSTPPLGKVLLVFVKDARQG